MLFASIMPDLAVVGLLLGVVLVIGIYFRSAQVSTQEYLLGGRALGGFPVGISLTAALVGGTVFIEMPGQAYYSGLRLLALPLAVWIALPLATQCIMPLYHGLGLCSICEYLEYRFDRTTRIILSGMSIVWRLLWSAALLALPCQLLASATGSGTPVWLTVLVLGVTVTAYTTLGGIKAVIWSNVIQVLVMALGLGVMLIAILTSLDGGISEVWRVADDLGRPGLTELRTCWSEPWKFWSLLPGFVLLAAFLYSSDQVTLQRCLSLGSLKAARRSFRVGSLGISVLAPALAYSGLCLLAYYQANPQAMRPIWVVNVDSLTRRSITFPETRHQPLLDASGRPRVGLLTGEKIMDPTSGRPLIDWERDKVDAATLPGLIAEGRVLHPNSKEPCADVAALIEPDSGQIWIDRLAMRWQNEIILHERAQAELLPRYLAQPLPMGVAGLLSAAIFAAVMAALGSGIHAVGTLLIVDFHRGLGFGRRRLALRLNKEPADLNEQDEMRLARPLILSVGLLVTVAAMGLAQAGWSWRVVIAAASMLGGPMLAVFLLGIFTRRGTGRGVLLGLVIGVTASIWHAAALSGNSLWRVWPLDNGWTMGIGTLIALISGYVFSLLLGQRKSKAELRGLILGAGRLGDRLPEPIEMISVRDEDISRPH